MQRRIVAAVFILPSLACSAPPSQSDATLVRLLDAKWGCRVALHEAERRLEAIQYPGMPEDWVERVAYRMNNPSELERLEGLLQEAINGSENFAAVSASSRVLARRLAEAGPEMEVTAYRSQLEAITAELVQALLGRLDPPPSGLPGRATEPPPCPADTETASVIATAVESVLQEAGAEERARVRLDSILDVEIPIVRASGYGGYDASARALSGFVRWVHQNDLGPIGDARDVARACRDGNPAGLEAYYCGRLER